MTKSDELLASAIIDQINAELAAHSLTMKDVAERINRPYDSTRNYLRKERQLPFGIFLEICTAIGVPAEKVIARARERM